MIRLLTVSSILCFASVSAIAQDRTYTVQSGDTLGSIAREQLGPDGSWRELCELNGLEECDLLFVGQTIRLTRDAQTSIAEPGQGETAEDDAAPEMPATTEDTAQVDGMTVSLAQGSGADIRPGSAFSMSRDGSGASLSGHPESGQPSPSGRTDGIGIDLGEEIEAAASGQTVTVTLYGSAPEGHQFQAAYSTNDVGNSGWRTLSFGPDGSASFDFAVPPVNLGNSDWLGILPDPDATGAAITVSRIEVSLAE